MNSVKNFKFADLTKEGPKGAIVSPDFQSIDFYCVRPIIVQPSEIQKIQPGVACEVLPGYVLQISTYPQLAEQASEIFPALIVIDHTNSGELFLAVRNHGRNPLNLMPGTPIARGHLVHLTEFDIEDFDLHQSEPETSRPQKKKPFSFEVK
jgi:dUTPase